MPVGEICNRDVVFASGDTGVVEAAQLMRNQHVGDLVIVEERAGEPVPTGIVTDRDLVVEVVAAEVEPTSLTLKDIATNELVTARESDGVWESLQRMRGRGIRRMPVVNERGALVGILTLDDLLDLFAEELQDLVAAVRRERVRESRTRI